MDLLSDDEDDLPQPSQQQQQPVSYQQPQPIPYQPTHFNQQPTPLGLHSLLPQSEVRKQPPVQTRPVHLHQPSPAAAVIRQSQPPPVQRHSVQAQDFSNQRAPPTQTQPQRPISAAQHLIPPSQTANIQPRTTTISPQSQSTQRQVHGVKPQLSGTSNNQSFLLISLIRATTKYATSEDQDIYNHVKTCTDSNCKQSKCSLGKYYLEHYESCASGKCYICAFPRLIILKDKNRTENNIYERFFQYRGKMQDEIAKIKKIDAEIERRKTESMEAERVASRVARDAYSKYRAAFDSICNEIYTVWYSLSRTPSSTMSSEQQSRSTGVPPLQKDSNAESQATSRSNITVATKTTSLHSATQSTVASGLLQTPTPAPTNKPATTQTKPLTQAKPVAQNQQNKSTVNTGKKSTVAPVSTSTAQQPTTNASSQQKLPPSEIDGYKVDYLIGDRKAMASTLDNVLESFTLVSTAADDEWVKGRESYEAYEPGWRANNILSLNDIETEATKLNSKLASLRECEYISQAAQEIVMDCISQAIDIARHRKGSCPSDTSPKLTLTLEDIQLAIDRSFTATKLAYAYYRDGGSCCAVLASSSQCSD